MLQIRWNRAKRFAKPFLHVVIDGALPREQHARMAGDLDQEPLALVDNEIYLHLRSSEPPQQPALRAFHGALDCAEVSKLFGRRVTRVDGSAYVYLPGHYLLPHSDSRKSEDRSVAYAYYIGAPKAGGELELFGKPGKRIDAKANRLVLFEVNDAALHRVREVLEGARTSMAGWFYP